jgi:acetoin utilization deacetylase AcuC-like enzyme
MLTVFSPTHRLHHGTELKNGALTPSFEQPSRADTILARVQAVNLGEIIAPQDYDFSHYTRVHGDRYVRFLETAWEEWSALGHRHDALPLVWPVRDLRHDVEPAYIDGKLGYYAMDAGSPIAANTWQAVRGSANVALTAADALSATRRGAFALCRPPGHHAAANYMGGYCYLNNAAIAAQRCLDQGARRVAVLDVDFHHGNGTQSIFYDRADVLFVSLHGDPSVSYPYFSGHADERGAGAGDGFNRNFPLPRGTAWDTYGPALAEALHALRGYAPNTLIVSLGVDAFEGDPISHFRLTSEDFTRIGEAIGTLGAPTLFVMEGGYMVDEIGINAVNVLQGFEAAA